MKSSHYNVSDARVYKFTIYHYCYVWKKEKKEKKGKKEKKEEEKKKRSECSKRV